MNLFFCRQTFFIRILGTCITCCYFKLFTMKHFIISTNIIVTCKFTAYFCSNTRILSAIFQNRNKAAVSIRNAEYRECITSFCNQCLTVRCIVPTINISIITILLSLTIIKVNDCSTTLWNKHKSLIVCASSCKIRKNRNLNDWIL